MAELPGGFWSGWILVLTLVSLTALAWLVLSAYFTSEADHNPDNEPVWDDDLTEGSNAPPFWWFWMLLAAMVFSLIYLMLFPGLGSYPGLLNWSQGSRLAESYDGYLEQFADARKDIIASDLLTLQNDVDKMETARRIFRRECSVCHGATGKGQASLFPDLYNEDWQWGSAAEQIEHSIRQGRKANMISWKAILDETAIEDIAYFLLPTANEEARQSANAASSENGQTLYSQNCAACHGADLGGNTLLGAPNLKDQSWLYGDSLPAIRQSIAEGRSGEMPAFSKRLSDVQIKLLVALLTPVN